MSPGSIHILGSRQFGGADRFYVRLVVALNQAGHRALAVNRPRSPVADALRDAGIEQIHLPLANKWDWFSTHRIRKLVAARRPTVVQTYMGRATRLTRLPADSPARHLARLGGYYKIAGYYEHADAWVGNTAGVCRYLEEAGMPPDRVFRIGNFVDSPVVSTESQQAATRARYTIPDEAIVLYALGRFIDIKGFDDLLDAFARLPRDIHGRPLYLVISGDGPLREKLRRQAARLSLNDRVVWTGWLNELSPWYSLADVMVCPSRHETLGNVILEAWSYRLPVVTTDTPGATSLVEPGKDALQVSRRDPVGLAGATEQLLAWPEAERRSLGEAGHRKLMASHGKEAVVRSYLDLYRRLSDQPR